MKRYLCKILGMVRSNECYTCNRWRDTEIASRVLCKRINLVRSPNFGEISLNYLSGDCEMKHARLLAEIEHIKVSHPRADDFKAKFAREDDCLGMCFDATSDDCARCMLEATYKGSKYLMRDLCKLLMHVPLREEDVEIQLPQSSITEDKDAGAVREDIELNEKPASGGKRGDIILDLLAQAELSQSELATRMGIRGSTTNIALKKLMTAGKIGRKKKDSTGFTYFIVGSIADNM